MLEKLRLLSWKLTRNKVGNQILEKMEKSDIVGLTFESLLLSWESWFTGACTTTSE